MFTHTDRILEMFPHTGDIHNGVSGHVETLFLCPWELVKKQGRGYNFTIFENESMILLFGVGRDYEFTDN